MPELSHGASGFYTNRLAYVWTARTVLAYVMPGASLRGQPTPPATLAQEGKPHQPMRSGQRCKIAYFETKFFFPLL